MVAHFMPYEKQKMTRLHSETSENGLRANGVANVSFGTTLKYHKTPKMSVRAVRRTFPRRV